MFGNCPSHKQKTAVIKPWSEEGRFSSLAVVFMGWEERGAESTPDLHDFLQAVCGGAPAKGPPATPPLPCPPASDLIYFLELWPKKVAF